MGRHNRLGSTGRLFEEEILGRCLFVWDGRTYFSYKKSMGCVRCNQPGNPAHPRCPNARILHRRVALGLGVSEWDELSFYTSVGSPLDYFHGVDAFFEWKGTVVTIDVTLDARKQVKKADIIYHQNDGLDWLAQQVTDEFSVKRWRRTHAR